MAAALIPIALGVSAAAAAGGAVYSGVAQSEAADYNAKVAKRQAQWETMRSQAEAQRVAAAGTERQSALRARLAAGGMDLTSPGPLGLLEENAARTNVDVRSVLAGGQQQASNLRSQAGQYSQQATQAGAIAGLGATSALLQGAGSIYGYQQGEIRQQKAEEARLNALTDSYTGNRGAMPPLVMKNPWDF